MKEVEYTPSHIANYFLACASDEKIDITPLKLMKLVYFAYAWYLHLTDGEELFSEEIQAWKHGPVIPSLYHEFKHFGLYGNIKNTYATYIDLDNERNLTLQRPTIEANILESDDNLNSGICGVWFHYKNKTGDELESISHHKDSVWTEYYQAGKNVQLTNDPEKLKKIKDRARIAYNKAVMELSGVSVD